MTDRVLIPFNNTLLALTLEQLVEAQRAARDLCPSPATVSTPAAPDVLLTAEQLEQRTGVSATWWEQAARENRVPHVRIGRYARFEFADVAEYFRRPLDSDSNGAVRQWRKSSACE